MKSLILTLSFFPLLSYAQSAQTPIRALDSNDDTHYYYYNADNQLFWELFGTTRREYEYNPQGLPTSMKQYAWVSAQGDYTLSTLETYEYDAQGNMTKKDHTRSIGTPYEVKYSYQYFNYVNGIATYYDEYKNGSLYYMYKQVPTYDSANRLTSCNIYYADPDDYTNPTHETVNFTGKEAENKMTYDEAGSLIKENKGKTEYTYTYTELNKSLAPANLTATDINGKVTLTWDAVPNAEKYIVSYDQERIEVSTTTYTTTVNTGNRYFTVQAVIDGIERNAATPVLAEIEDEGKLPVTDLAVGTIFETEEATESEEWGTRVFYNIPLTWSLPAGHSEIVKFDVHYNSKTYGEEVPVPVVDPAATSFTLRVDPFEVTEWDEDGTPYKGIDTPIFITVTYVTGKSDKSNVVIVNPYKTLGHETSITSPSLLPSTSTPAYNLSGLPVTPSVKGIIIKDGKKYLAK